MSESTQGKLLVTGISGFLGSCLVELNPKDWKLYGLYHHHRVSAPNLTTLKADLSKPLELQKLFYKIQPDAVIHLAAMSNPNYCENNPAISKKVNVDSAVQLANLCKTAAIPFVFTSTDLVFDGKHGPYDEQAVPNPVNVYGQQKALAEREILAHYPAACIARLPVMFGLPKWGNSFMTSWVQHLKEGKKVFAFTDEFRTKVSGETAVKGLLLLLDKNSQGIWHLGGKESISRYDFAIKMAEVFDLPKELVAASRQAEVKMAAARPRDVSLDSGKAFGLGYDPVGLEVELRRLFKR